MRNWFEVDTEGDNEFVTYKKWWKLQLLKWIVLPPVVVLFWTVMVPCELIRVFISGGLNDLKWKLRNFDDHILMAELFKWYRLPTKRVK